MLGLFIKNTVINISPSIDKPAELKQEQIIPKSYLETLVFSTSNRNIINQHDRALLHITTKQEFFLVMGLKDFCLLRQAGSFHAAQAGLKFSVQKRMDGLEFQILLLALLPKCWDKHAYRHTQQNLNSYHMGIDSPTQIPL